MATAGITGMYSTPFVEDSSAVLHTRMERKKNTCPRPYPDAHKHPFPHALEIDRD